MIKNDKSEHVYISSYHVMIQCLIIEKAVTRGPETVNIFFACEKKFLYLT